MTRMDWTQLDWQTLDRLRADFLSGAAAKNGPYWRSRADLENYDFTYAERIGWKWDAVLLELRRRGWAPPAQARALLDWGCGSGVASRRVLRAFGAENFDTLLLWDHSPLARDYAAEVARREFPKLRVEALAGEQGIMFAQEDQTERTDQSDRSDRADQAGASRILKSAFTLVLSHVINELPPPALGELLALARQAEAVIWVEPGTHADSRALVAVREQFRESFSVVAPCAHEAACGLLAAGNERHWCHNFAEPPPNIHADSNWVKFGQRAGIDLRSLPYSFLVLEKKHGSANAEQPAGVSRIIGRPRFHKAHASICNCDINGVSELTFYKRTAPAFFKTLERAPAHPPLYVWERDTAAPGRIVSGRAANLPLGH